MKNRTYLPGPKVDERYDVTPMTRWRWQRNPKLGFPPPAMTVNGRHFWDLADLDEFDRRHAARRSVSDQEGAL